ncbi:Esterase/lipase/thioesterase, partial [Heterobasidion irregulare TC 32-1]
MSQYAHLSTIDPEFAEIADSLGPPPDAEEDAENDIHAMRVSGALLNAWYPGSTFPSVDKYDAKDHRVAVQGGEIVVRSVVPTLQVAGETFPLLVWYHAGGWSLGNIDMDDANLRHICVDLRISVINVDYRLAPENPFPTGFDDCYAALKWAAEHERELSASLSKGFIVAGASAGGNLSAAVALRARDDPFFKGRNLTGQILHYPALCHPDVYPDKYKNELLSMDALKGVPIVSKKTMFWCYELLKAPPASPYFSPLLAPSHAGLPPACLQICGLDPLRDESFLFEKLLREQGVKTKLHVYPGVPHGVNALCSQITTAKRFEREFREAIVWIVGLSAQ